MTKIALALGGNLGNEKKNFLSIEIILNNIGVTNTKLSSLYKNPAIGCIPNTPDFTNAAIIGDTAINLLNLLKICKKIESLFGRSKEHESNTSRILDIDIILYGVLIIDTPIITIPHPRALKRNFVLAPLMEIAWNWIFPTNNLIIKENFKKIIISKKYRNNLIKIKN